MQFRTLLGIVLVTIAPAVLAQDTWEAKAPMPTARLGLATCAVGGKIYAIGGYAQANGPGLQTVEEYDPATNTWAGKANMPTGRRWLTASSVNGKCYAIGGHTGSGQPGLVTVEEYDPGSNGWATKAGMPAGRVLHAAAVLDGKIYIVGGGTAAGNPVTTLAVYDPVMDDWETAADMPMARGFGLAASAANGRLYAIGGTADGQDALANVEEYDPGTNAWTARASMPTERYWVAASTVNGKIYVVGGSIDGLATTGAVEEYDPAQNSWTARVSMPGARGGLATSVVADTVYAMGGSTTRPVPHPATTANEAYSPPRLFDVLLDLEALTDVDNSGAVDAAVLAPGNTVYVRDGATGDPITDFTVFDEAWQALDMAVTPGGANSLVGVLAQKNDDLVSVAVHRAADGAFVREIPFFGRKWVPSGVVYVANADGPGGSAFAVVAKHRDDNRVSVQLRRRSDGSLVNTTTYFRNNWEPVDLDTMDDISGNSRPEVILLGVSDLNQIVVFVKDASDKSVVNKISYLGKTTTPKAISVIDDIGASAAPELPVLGERPDGRNIVQNRDSLTDVRVDNVFFLNGRWDSIDVLGLGDVNGNSSADLAVLAQHESTGAIRCEVRDAATGDLIRTITFLGASWDARAFAVFDDINGNGVQELGIVARQEDGDIRVQLKDAESGATVRTIDIP